MSCVSDVKYKKIPVQAGMDVSWAMKLKLVDLSLKESASNDLHLILFCIEQAF